MFPAEIHIEQAGVTVKIPGLFKGDSKFFDYQHIASVGCKGTNDWILYRNIFTLVELKFQLMGLQVAR